MGEYDKGPGIRRGQGFQPLRRREVLRSALVGSAGLAAASVLTSPHRVRADEPKRDGNLRVALLGGGTSDTVDAHGSVSVPDTARALSLYEGLTRLDADGKVINVLADSMEPNATATEWTIRLRKGVKFHDGKTLKAEDVAFTFRRIADPKAPFSGAAALQALDLGNMKVMDDLTLRVPMTSPYAAFPDCISASFLFSVVPVGYDPKAPVGTGPFKYQSFSPGQQSVFTRR